MGQFIFLEKNWIKGYDPKNPDWKVIVSDKEDKICKKFVQQMSHLIF